MNEFQIPSGEVNIEFLAERSMDDFRLSEMDSRMDEAIASPPPVEGIFAAECILKKRSRRVNHKASFGLSQCYTKSLIANFCSYFDREMSSIWLSGEAGRPSEYKIISSTATGKICVWHRAIGSLQAQHLGTSGKYSRLEAVVRVWKQVNRLLSAMS